MQHFFPLESHINSNVSYEDMVQCHNHYTEVVKFKQNNIREILKLFQFTWLINSNLFKVWLMQQRFVTDAKSLMTVIIVIP